MWEPRYSPHQYVLSRLHGPETSYRSTYGVWNDDFRLRGGGLMFQRCNRGGGGTAPPPRGERRSRSPSAVRGTTTTQRRRINFDALFAPTSRCKKPRCAAVKHGHKPRYCVADKWKERKGDEISKKTCTIMTNRIQAQDRIQNCDITKGLGNLKEVNEAEELEYIPGQEYIPGEEQQICERGCGECPNTGQEFMQASAISCTEVKPTRTLGTNTVGLFSMTKECELLGRVLKEQNNNIMEDKACSPRRRKKMATPIPRVALLKASKPKPYENINKQAMCQIQMCEPWVGSPHLTPRIQCPQNLMGQAKPGRRMFTPPTSSPCSQSNTPRSVPSPRQDPNPTTGGCNQSQRPEPTSLCRKSSPKESDSRCETTASEFGSSSECASNGSSNDDDSCEEATFRRCAACGKSENGNPAGYRNNPLYSPLTRGKPSPGSSGSWGFFNNLLEVFLLVLLGGALTLGMIPYVESVFRAYMADYCRSSGKDAVGMAGASPEVTADGMQGGVVKWVTCMKDNTSSTLTPVKKR